MLAQLGDVRGAAKYLELHPRPLTKIELIHSEFSSKVPHPELHGGKRAKDVWAQLEDGGTSAQAIAGVMLESFLVGGAQNLDVAEHAAGRAELVYGQSVTDACMEWDVSVSVLDQLAASARKRREAK